MQKGKLSRQHPNSVPCTPRPVRNATYKHLNWSTLHWDTLRIQRIESAKDIAVIHTTAKQEKSHIWFPNPRVIYRDILD